MAVWDNNTLGFKFPVIIILGISSYIAVCLLPFYLLFYRRRRIRRFQEQLKWASAKKSIPGTRSSVFLASGSNVVRPVLLTENKSVVAVGETSNPFILPEVKDILKRVKNQNRGAPEDNELDHGNVDEDEPSTFQDIFQNVSNISSSRRTSGNISRSSSIHNKAPPSNSTNDAKIMSSIAEEHIRNNDFFINFDTSNAKDDETMIGNLTQADSTNNLIDAYMEQDGFDDLSRTRLSIEPRSDIRKISMTSEKSRPSISDNIHTETPKLANRVSNPQAPNKPKRMLNALMKGLSTMQSFNSGPNSSVLPNPDSPTNESVERKNKLERQNTEKLLGSFSAFADVAGISVTPLKSNSSSTWNLSKRKTNEISKWGSLSILSSDTDKNVGKILDKTGRSSSSVMLNERSPIESSLAERVPIEKTPANNSLRPKIPSNQSSTSNSEFKSAWNTVLNAIVMRGPTPSIEEEKITEDYDELISDIVDAIKRGEVKFDAKKKRIPTSEMKSIQIIISNSVKRIQSQGRNLLVDCSRASFIRTIVDQVQKRLTTVSDFDVTMNRNQIVNPYGNEEGRKRLGSNGPPRSPRNGFVETNRRVLLMQIFGNPDYLKTFENFLKSIYCVENLQFYQDVILYRKSFSGEGDPASLARAIYEKYLLVEALNVDQQDKLNVLDQIKANSFEPNLFESLENHVFHIMCSDSLRKFMQTDEFFDMDISYNMSITDLQNIPATD